MRVTHTNVELYRHTSVCRNIQKNMGAMHKKMGKVTHNTKKSTETREDDFGTREPAVRYVRNKENACLDTIINNYSHQR
jgi:hypothetical protein